MKRKIPYDLGLLGNSFNWFVAVAVVLLLKNRNRRQDTR